MSLETWKSTVFDLICVGRFARDALNLRSQDQMTSRIRRRWALKALHPACVVEGQAVVHSLIRSREQHFRIEAHWRVVRSMSIAWWAKVAARKNCFLLHWQIWRVPASICSAFQRGSRMEQRADHRLVKFTKIKNNGLLITELLLAFNVEGDDW